LRVGQSALSGSVGPSVVARGGHSVGSSNDLEDTLKFAALQGIKPMVEVLPLEKAADGYQRMLANQARFRVVLTTAETGTCVSSPNVLVG
jgi:hypothetical protein